jgi:hypothetical protein
MSLHVIIASHLDLYRIITIKECIESISDCVEYANLDMINCYISYSYEDFIYSELDSLEKTLQTHKNLMVIFYRHKQKKLQFEHIQHIMEINTFDKNDWIMFSDDDDISIKTRIKLFLFYLNLNDFDVFRSNMILIERDKIIKKPYTLLNLLNYQYYKRPVPDFATIIVKIEILKEFFDFYKNEFTLYTDCAFSDFIDKYKVYTSKEYLYVARTRMFTTEEKFLELYTNTPSTT